MRSTPVTTCLTLSLVLSVCVGGGAAASPELIVDVDVNDEVWLRDHKMTEGDVKDLAAKLKRNGCQTLIIRCGCLGILPYRIGFSRLQSSKHNSLGSGEQTMGW